MRLHLNLFNFHTLEGCSKQQRSWAGFSPSAHSIVGGIQRAWSSLSVRPEAVRPEAVGSSLPASIGCTFARVMWLRLLIIYSSCSCCQLLIAISYKWCCPFKSSARLLYCYYTRQLCLGSPSSGWLSASHHCQVFLRGRGVSAWSLAPPAPSHYSLLLGAELKRPRLHVHPTAPVCFSIFSDGVGPSANCVWPCVSGGLTVHTHTEKCFPSGGTVQWDGLLFRERPLWFRGQNSHRRSQEEMAR